jgi:hypothetical protein
MLLRLHYWRATDLGFSHWQAVVMQFLSALKRAL